MNRNDKAALMLAMEMCRAESPVRARQLDAKLENESWEDVAQFAAFSAQSESLALQPWESPPCIADGFHGDAASRKLLREMLDAGVSRYDPDPMAALERAKKGAA